MQSCSLLNDVLPGAGGGLVMAVLAPLIVLWLRRQVRRAIPVAEVYRWPFPFNLLVELYARLTARSMTADLLWCVQAWFLLIAVIAPVWFIGGTSYLLWLRCL